MCMRDNLGDKKKKQHKKKNSFKKTKNKTRSICGCIFFCFVECIEVIFTHHLWLCHIAYMCLQGRKKFKNVNIWNGNRKINKWCFIKIFSKNAAAPRFVDSLGWRKADQWAIRVVEVGPSANLPRSCGWFVWKVVTECLNPPPQPKKKNKRRWKCSLTESADIVTRWYRLCIGISRICGASKLHCSRS